MWDGLRGASAEEGEPETLLIPVGGAGLEQPGQVDAGRPDTPRVLWSAWGSLPDAIAEVERRWGRRAATADLAAVSGPWATVLWDPASGDHVIVADPVGVLPLYWARVRDGSIVVGSWLAQLVDRDDVDDALDYDGVVIASALGCHGPATLESTQFLAVRKVAMGTAVRVHPDGSVRRETFWDPTRLPGPDESLSAQDCADLLRERVDAAIRRLTPTDKRVGAHVSSGVDCTAMACRANQILRESGGGIVAGYSWSPTPEHVPRFAGDERGILDDVAAAEGFPIRLVHPDESGDWWLGLDLARYPQSTHVRERYTLPQARADGIEVMLSGWGGR